MVISRKFIWQDELTIYLIKIKISLKQLRQMNKLALQILRTPLIEFIMPPHTLLLVERNEEIWLYSLPPPLTL